MVMESKTTSKTSCLKALLLKAWRERWTDLQWGINIKTVLPRGVSGDVYNLADCILQQAVVGSGANKLVLSYLRHSLSAQLVSHAAVLQRLSKYNTLSKVHCVHSLLEFLEGMLPGVTCCGKPEETVLATAVLSIACWLLTILIQCDSPQLTKKASFLFQTLMGNEFYTSMMCLAKHNDPELFAETNRMCAQLSGTLKEPDDLLKAVKHLENLDVSTSIPPISSGSWPGALVQNWLAVQIEKNPTVSTGSICARLKLFQKLKGFNNSRLFAELIRGSLLSLRDVNQIEHESTSQWGAFAILKVPFVLKELRDPSSITSALELVMQHSSLLDAFDSHNYGSTLECLLGQLLKIRLISDVQAQHLLDKRKMPLSGNLDPGKPGIPKVIVCAEPHLSGVFKALSKETYQNQHTDSLLGMLQQVLAGESFKLILAVATVQSQLKTLVSLLIRFNEWAKSGGDKTRCQLFDISFIILAAIVQNYGATNVLNANGDSLFEQWISSCMLGGQKPKGPDHLLRLGDQNTVEMLLQQFNTGESDFKPNVKWQDIILNMAGVMHEVLIAWEQGALVASDVKRILDAVKGQMCCLPLAAAAWLCAYMRTAPQENLLKPINMVQQLLSPPTAEADENLVERWESTCEIIRKMQRDVQLPLPTKNTNHLVSRQPAVEKLRLAWSLAVERGWLEYTSAKLFHCLLDTAGARWLVSSVVQELLKLRYRDKLQTGVDLALAIFYVDIRNCTMELLSHILPQLLFNDIQTDNLMEPQLLALAYLTSYCIYAAYAPEIVADPKKDEGEEDDDDAEPPSKILHLADPNEVPQEQIMTSLRQLLTIFESGIQDGLFTQQTYFAFYMVKSLVEIKFSCTSTILTTIPPALVTDLLRTLPELFSYPLLLNLHDVLTTSGRTNMARDFCVLRNYHLRNIS